MACSRGAAAPDAHTQKRLFAASAGYCQNPGCAQLLFSDEAGKSIHIAEMAHVYAASEGAIGARILEPQMILEWVAKQGHSPGWESGLSVYAITSAVPKPCDSAISST